MSEDIKVMTLPGAFALAKQGLFPTRDQLVGVDEHGAALYAWDRTLVVRPSGIRPPGVRPYRAGAIVGGVQPELVGMATDRHEGARGGSRTWSRKGGWKSE